MSPTATVAPVACPGCGESELLEGDARAWYCRVCGQHGPRRLRLAPAVAPPNPLPRLLTAIVQAHLGPGDWQVAAIAPLAQWPRSLQKELGATLGALGDTVVLVLERVP